MIIGRKKELEQLVEAYESEYSEFVAVYGRRRVGKTFLVREAFDYRFTFQHAGLSKSNMKKQLAAWKSSWLGKQQKGRVADCLRQCHELDYQQGYQKPWRSA